MARYEVMLIDEAIKRGYAVENPHYNSDYYEVCVDTMLKRIVCSGGGEPEDRNLYRDFHPLVDELNRLADQRTIHPAPAHEKE